MSKLQASLHALSLAACVALGAACWALWEKPAPPQPAVIPHPEAPRADPVSETRLQRLEEEVAALKARPAASAALPFAQAPAARTAAPMPPATEAVLAALDDPKVQARLQALSQEAEQASWDPVNQIFKHGTLSEAQHKEMSALLEENGREIGEIFQKVPKELTMDQARLAVEQARVQMDNKVQALLGPDLFRTYQEGIRPLREATLQMFQIHRTGEDGEHRFFIQGGDGKDVVILPAPPEKQP